MTRKPLLASVALALLTGVVAPLAPGAAFAQGGGVSELLRQGEFWQSRGRADLAEQAYRRVLEIDPANAVARRALAGPAPAAAPESARPTASASSAPRAPAAPVDPAGPSRAAGFAALERGQLATAASRFEAALRIRPRDPDALGGLGLVRLRQERFGEARDLLTRASAAGSPDKWAEALDAARFFAGLRAAEAGRDAGRLVEAENQARELAGSSFKDAGLASTLLADILTRQGRYADAASVLEEAAARRGETASPAAADLRRQAARARALDAAATGDSAEAERLFQTAVIGAPNDPWLLYEYARFLVSDNRPSTALSVIQPLEATRDPEGLFAAALIYNQLGMAAEARALLGRIPEANLTPAMRELALDVRVEEVIARSKTLRAEGRSAEALAALNAVSQNANLGPVGQARLAEALYEAGNATAAATLARQSASRVGPDATAEALGPVVVVLSRTGQEGAAQTLIEQVAAREGNTKAVSRLVALAASSSADRLRLAGARASAFETLRTAWEQAPDDPDLLAALGRLYQSGGLHEEAAAVYRMLLAQKPTDPDVLTAYAQASIDAGDVRSARNAVRQAINLRKDDPDVYILAAGIERQAGNTRGSLQYLRTAESLRLAQARLGTGQAFLPGNPFTDSGAASGTNPFDLARRPGRVEAPVAASGTSRGFRFGASSEKRGAILDMPETSMAAANARPVQVPESSRSAPTPRTGLGLLAARSTPAQGDSDPGAVWDTGPSGESATGLSATSDPTLNRIYAEIDALSGTAEPSAEAGVSFRNRSGESGLSNLQEITATARLSVPVGNGRVVATVSPTVIDAGTLGRSALARFGTNATPEALAIVAEEPAVLAPAPSQYATGASVSLGYDGPEIDVDIGTTPLGFDNTQVQGGVSWTPRFNASTTSRFFVERRPVTDSIVSYAGVEDPRTWQFYGAVMASGAGLGVSREADGTGLYADARYRSFDGENVPDNSSVEVNIGGYLQAYATDTTRITAGANFNYQAYDNNQNFFTFGQGGYFSPQSFFSVAFPVNITSRVGAWDVKASLAPGLQSFEEDGVPIYPTLAEAQGQLDALKLLNNDVRARFDGNSKSGFAFAGSASASYRLTTRTSLTGELRFNSFGDYNEFQSMLKLTQLLGGGPR